MIARAIVNPRSGGKRTAKRWPEVESAMREVLPDLEVVRTEAQGDATRLARQALQDGVDTVVGVGGDGTLNEVVNGFFDERGDPIAPEAELAIMMMGTGGDFRRSFGIGKTWQECLARIAEGKTRTIDVGRLELVGHDGEPVVRLFDNIASFGASGAIVDAVNEASVSKWFGGKFAFRWATIMGLMRYKTRPVRIVVDDAFDEVVDLTLCAVCNGRYFGGGMCIGPTAELDDGLFDVVIVEGMGTWGFIKNSGKLGSGEHIGQQGIRHVRGRRVVAEPADDTPTLLDVDGEGPGRLPATFEIRPATLRVRA